jgi:hypothetical protein
MLSEEQIERAAREYCRLEGFDPEVFDRPWDWLDYPGRKWLLNWQVAAERIREHERIETVIAAVREGRI